MVLGAGMYGTLGTAGVAVVLALGEVVVQLYQRRPRKLLLVAKVAGAFGAVVALVGLFLIADSYIGMTK
jgi:hypothetical protein